MERILKVFKKKTMINLTLECTKDMHILLENLEITKISKVSYLFYLLNMIIMSIIKGQNLRVKKTYTIRRLKKPGEKPDFDKFSNESVGN